MARGYREIYVLNIVDSLQMAFRTNSSKTTTKNVILNICDHSPPPDEEVSRMGHGRIHILKKCVVKLPFSNKITEKI